MKDKGIIPPQKRNKIEGFEGFHVKPIVRHGDYLSTLRRLIVLTNPLNRAVWIYQSLKGSLALCSLGGHRFEQ